jgi:hypothetical protein
MYMNAATVDNFDLILWHRLCLLHLGQLGVLAGLRVAETMVIALYNEAEIAFKTYYGSLGKLVNVWRLKAREVYWKWVELFPMSYETHALARRLPPRRSAVLYSYTLSLDS